MKIIQSDIENLKSSLYVARVSGIESVVITDNKIRGISPNSKIAVISNLDYSFDPSLKIGIGRISEFEKRISVFSGDLTAQGKINDNKDVLSLTLQNNKSKLEFRCTAERLIKYPKANEDPELLSFTLSKSEIQELSRAIKTLGAEILTICIKQDFSVNIECLSSTNELFCTEAEEKAVFLEQYQNTVNQYSASDFIAVLDAAARTENLIKISVGESGTSTILVNNYVIIILPEYKHED
jgi:hypothetical protein